MSNLGLYEAQVLGREKPLALPDSERGKIDAPDTTRGEPSRLRLG